MAGSHLLPFAVLIAEPELAVKRIQPEIFTKRGFKIFILLALDDFVTQA
jgi:hypothetical protein